MSSKDARCFETLYTIEYDRYYNTFFVGRSPGKNSIVGYVTKDPDAANKIVDLLNSSQEK